MNNLKKYSKPVMQMEQFVPQEYINACWHLNLHCTGGAVNGEHWVFTYPADGSTYLGEVLHGEHDLGYLTCKTEGDARPSDTQLAEIYASVGEFRAALASDAATNSNPRQLHPNKQDDYTRGFAWTMNGEMHFMAGDELVWSLIEERPNAS